MRSSNCTKKHSSKPARAKSSSRSSGVEISGGSRSGTQMRGRMVRKREDAGTPARLAQPQRLPRDLAMAAMESVEETDREHQRPVAARASSS